MKIGVPKEIKTNENRIALVPAGAESLIGAGHSVLVEVGAGIGSGFPDEAYTAVGAKIAPDAVRRPEPARSASKKSFPPNRDTWEQVSSAGSAIGPLIRK